jgi:hypothetical protein
MSFSPEQFKGASEYESRPEGYPEIEIGTQLDTEGLALLVSLRISNKEALEEYTQLAKGNDESMRIIAVAFNRPNGLENAIHQLVRHKEYSKEEATACVNRAFEILTHSDPSVIAKNTCESNRLQEVWPRIKADIRASDDFFHPRAELFDGKRRIIYLPDGPWRESESGFGVELGEEMFLSIDPNSSANTVHEYLHSHINAMTSQMTIHPEETEQLATLAKSNMRNHYGTTGLSLWNEAIIRAYRDGFRPENAPMTLEAFQRQIHTIPRDRLEDHFKKSNIPYTVDDFLHNETIQIDVYEKFVRDRLIESAWKFLCHYNEARQNDPTLRFENYFRDHYRDMLPDHVEAT